MFKDDIIQRSEWVDFTDEKEEVRGFERHDRIRIVTSVSGSHLTTMATWTSLERMMMTLASIWMMIQVNVRQVVVGRMRVSCYVLMIVMVSLIDGAFEDGCRAGTNPAS